MRRRKHATARGKLLPANERACFPNDVELKQSWRKSPLNLGGKGEGGVVPASIARLCSADNTNHIIHRFKESLHV